MVTHLAFPLSDIGQYRGRMWTLSDLIDALIDAGFPQEVSLDRGVFRVLVHVHQVCRDDVGVYVDVLKCKVRLAPQSENGRP